MSSEDTACAAMSQHLAVSEANNYLAVNLYKLLAKEESNVFFSPFSISTALAMVFCGSAHETAQEMRQVLGYDIAKIEDPHIKSYFQKLLSDIESGSDAYTLACANTVLSDKAFSVKDDFKALLEESFNALIQEVDFKNESESALEQINNWVKEKTNNKIQKILDSLDSSTVMIILNAVYFKGFWLHQFKEEYTRLQNFYNKGIEKNVKKIKMMHMKKKFPYIERESFKAVQLPYRGGDISMIILLPNARDGLEKLESSINHTFISDFLPGMYETKIDLALPKFQMEYSKSLKEQFQILGMKRIFQQGAHFDGITESKNLLISEIIHKAYVEVNEEGCEAAAVTGPVFVYCCFMEDPEFIVDHPFLFAIYNSKTNLILFMGRVDEL